VDDGTWISFSMLCIGQRGYVFSGKYEGFVLKTLTTNIAEITVLSSLSAGVTTAVFVGVPVFMTN